MTKAQQLGYMLGMRKRGFLDMPGTESVERLPDYDMRKALKGISIPYDLTNMPLEAYGAGVGALLGLLRGSTRKLSDEERKKGKTRLGSILKNTAGGAGIGFGTGLGSRMGLNVYQDSVVRDRDRIGNPEFQEWWRILDDLAAKRLAKKSPSK